MSIFNYFFHPRLIPGQKLIVNKKRKKPNFVVVFLTMFKTKRFCLRLQLKFTGCQLVDFCHEHWRNKFHVFVLLTHAAATFIKDRCGVVCQEIRNTSSVIFPLLYADSTCGNLGVKFTKKIYAQQFVMVLWRNCPEIKALVWKEIN